MAKYKTESTFVYAERLEENMDVFITAFTAVPGKAGDWVVTAQNGYKAVVIDPVFRELFTLVTDGE